MNRKEAKAIVANTASENARKAGRKTTNLLDAVPAVVSREYLATLRKAFGIKARP